ncbi:MAG TPA: ketoacyl-ACP synthase III [Lacibacter sp.]|nr:ketoacyl-ACP synthase III [Lacibacter sp.]
MKQTIITGTGSYIPENVIRNSDFSNTVFYSDTGEALTTPSIEVVEKFKQITGIEERRYAKDTVNASDLGAMAAKEAISNSGINPEEIDLLIAAHNFGNVYKNTIQTDAVPSLASLIKHQLQIKNPRCVAFDLLFGCPGWVQGVITADAYFKAGMAKKALIVGTETLSRVIDIHDRDSMIFSDGAGATILEYSETGDATQGIISSCAQTHAIDEVEYINMGCSFYPGSDPAVRYIKMKGRKVYEYAMKFVPAAMKECLDKGGISIHELKKVFIHQANEKMDDGIIKRLYQLYGIQQVPELIMPMSIHWLGNSSVATVPTLLDLVRKGNAPPHELHKGDVILFASVGAGMNINAVCYRY